MPTFTIELEGLGLIYQKNHKWNVIFPNVACHKLRFLEANSAPVDVTGNKRKISVNVFGATSTHGDDGTFGRFVNVTESRMHGSKGIRRKQGWDTRGALLEVPNSMFSMLKETPSRFDLYEIVNGQEVYKHFLGEIGYSAKLVINADRIEVVLTGGGAVDGFPKTYVNDITLKFDNDCEVEQQSIEYTDFERLYDLTISGKNPNQRFRIKRFIDDQYDGKPIHVKTLYDTPLEPKNPGVPCHMVGSGDPPEGP